MIPSTNSKLLVAEDWKKIYQSYRNADFKSYDFETIRRTMIQYLQENYPEDFNDFIDSSEYIALIDLIAYLGQNLSFRIDLNARENFLETASRRDSILRLAQLVSYIPKRNVPASGFLKITALSTTDSVLDSSGNNLANTTIAWNDSTNNNWYQQFNAILNSAMEGSYVFGKPYDRQTIGGILTEQYRINSANTDVPIFSFLKNINGTNMNFEIVSSSFLNSTSVYEETPEPGNSFGLLYRNDNQGASSGNTGFFAYFKQGTLGLASFNIDTPVPNEIIGINTPNINDNDVWLWQLDNSGKYTTMWEKVPAVSGSNIIYNSLSNDVRNIFSVTSRDQDQIDLNFADGSFGNLPKGRFSLIYRQSNGLTYTIKPQQMTGISVEIPYYNKNNQSHILTMTLGLQYTVSNSSSAESNSSIQSKAPQAYYTQNRMVTAEDYNIAPLAISNSVVKVKSVNRTTSGISKYFELSDVSGKYSKTNIFAADGILYKNTHELNFEFTFANKNEIFAVMKEKVEPIIASTALRSFYFDQYDRPNLSAINLSWRQVNKSSGSSRGYFYDTEKRYPAKVSSYATSDAKYISVGSLIKFVAPTTTIENVEYQQYFSDKGNLVTTQSPTTRKYIWTKVVQIIGDGTASGTGILTDGTGPIIVSNVIPAGAIPVAVIPKFVNVISYSFESELVALCLSQRNFGISFDKIDRSWFIVADTNLDLVSNFNLEYQGDLTNSGKDSSWLIAFTWTGTSYKVRYRILDYIFESDKETAFFIDSNSVNFDYINNTIVKDQIDVLSINPAVIPLGAVNTSTYGSLGLDFKWQIDSPVIEADGYVEPKKVKISLYDYNNVGQITDPDTFDRIVEPMTTDPITGYLNKFVYFEKNADGLRYQLTTSTIYTAPTEVGIENITPVDGDLFYFYNQSGGVVKRYSDAAINSGLSPWIYEPNYFAFPGRSGLKFHYTHNSSENRRIDPSKSNIVDVYILTSDYDLQYRTWLSKGSGSEPLAPTSQSLEQSFSSSLSSIKTISDEIVFQPVKYKVLFGSNASVSLQATFKAVRNSTIPTSDNDLKTKILDAINNFFSLENWDFGQQFNFSELSTYVMNTLTPNITNFVIIPKVNNFGGLYEISCLSNEIFISGATVDNIEIIDAITASQLNTTMIITNSGS
jgi:hypothetical protein